MVYLKISDKKGNQEFSCNAELLRNLFFPNKINETQSGLLKVLHNFSTYCVKEEMFLFEQPPQCSAVTRSISHQEGILNNSEIRCYFLLILSKNHLVTDETDYQEGSDSVRDFDS